MQWIHVLSSVVYVGTTARSSIYGRIIIPPIEESDPQGFQCWSCWQPSSQGYWQRQAQHQATETILEQLSSSMISNKLSDVPTLQLFVFERGELTRWENLHVLFQPVLGREICTMNRLTDYSERKSAIFLHNAMVFQKLYGEGSLVGD